MMSLGLAAAGCAPAEAACSPACGGGQTCCDTGGANRCASLLVDPANCGACGTSCGAGNTCQLGHCIPAADTGVRPPDGGVPRDAPVVGDCHPSCASGSMCCGTQCVSAVGIATGDARMDPSFTNCRVCGVACDATTTSRCGLPHGSSSGSPMCLCGDLGPCAAGSNCELVGGSFSCINHMTDPMHCGTPGVACMPGEACNAGVCTCNGADGGADDAGMAARCPAGLTCTAAGCIDVMTDEHNCGTLGNACRNGETCNAGTCQCGTGARCPGGGIMGCGQTCCHDTCIEVDDYNCGGCGVACPLPMLCVHPPLGGMPHCGTEAAFVIACEATTDAAPSDGGMTTDDAGGDADVDAGADAGNDADVDADIDAH